MKTSLNALKVTFFSAILAISFAVVATPVLAFTPTLSVSSLSNNTVTLTVYGDANSTVQLYSQYTYVAALGVTNSSGYLYATVSSTSYNIPSGASVYVVVNGQQSPAVVWPSTSSVYCPLNYQAGTSYQYQYQNCPPLPVVPPPYVPPVVTPPISVTPVSVGSLSVGVNQTSTVYGQGGGAYVVTSNSSPSIVSASASGNTITFRGVQVGSATVMVCPSYAGYNNYPYGSYNNNYNYNNSYNSNYGYSNAPCASFLITVVPAISFSQNNVTLYGVGMSQSVMLYSRSYNNYQYNPYNSYNNSYYNYSTYFITGNTNPSAVSASINGNSLMVYGVGFGGSTITVCSTGGSCGTVYVSVNGSAGYQGYPTYYQPYTSYTEPSYVQPQTYYRAPTPLNGGWYRRW